MNAKEHYDNHLGNFYSWMVGDFASRQIEQQKAFERLGLRPLGSKIAIDLGCGHGLHSVSLAQIGYQVKAIDFNEQLLKELRINASGLAVEIFEDDILNVSKYDKPSPDLIICMGDTITHLNSKEEIQKLIVDSHSILENDGKLVLSFRDYSNELTDTSRFLPVKNDENRILTCFVEYLKDKVRITDLLHQKTEGGWMQKASSYFKIRISPIDIIEMLKATGMKISFNENSSRFQVLVANK